MNSVLNFSFHTTLLPVHAQNLRYTEIDSFVPASAAAALSEKGNYDFLVVKNQANIAGIFFPGYIKEVIHTQGDNIFRTHNFDINALPQSPTSLVEIIDTIDAHNIDFHSEIVNVNPTIWICPGGGGHIIFDDYCSIHHVRAHRI